MAELLQSASGNVVNHLKATSQEVAEQIEKSGSTVSQQIETSRTGLTLGMEGIVKDYIGQVDRSRGELIEYVDQAGGRTPGGLGVSTGQPLAPLAPRASAILRHLDAP